MKLKGISALITGASQGLGAAIARRFVEEGASVALCARSLDQLERTMQELLPLAEARGSKIFHIQADIASEMHIDNLAQQTLRVFPDLQVLVNNAGVYGPMGPLEANEWHEWKESIQINLLGPVYLARALIPHFKGRGAAKIINISGGGATSPLPFISSYAAAKAGLVRFTESLALELKDFHIDVNAVAPGLLTTRLTSQLLSAGPEKVGAEFYQKIKRMSAEGGTPPERAASLCAYLASSESDGITGKLISAPWDPWPFEGPMKERIMSEELFTLRRLAPKE